MPATDSTSSTDTRQERKPRRSTGDASSLITQLEQLKPAPTVATDDIPL